MDSNTPKIRFHNPNNYPPNHWSLQSISPTTLAHLTMSTPSSPSSKHLYSISLNPNDSRGYRCIIRYLHPISPQTTYNLSSGLNRMYDVREEKGLVEVGVVMEQVYKRLGMVVQWAKWGNNAHGFQEGEGDRVVVVGSQEEPGFLHMHLWGRGDPEHEYIPGVPLRGPQPGKMFQITPKSQSSSSQNPNIKWPTQQLQSALKHLKKQLQSYTATEQFKTEFPNCTYIDIDIYNYNIESGNGLEKAGTETGSGKVEEK